MTIERVCHVGHRNPGRDSAIAANSAAQRLSTNKNLDHDRLNGILSIIHPAHHVSQDRDRTIIKLCFGFANCEATLG
jgi:hypothetical protein